MRIDNESSLTPRWIVFGTALVYFALGSVLTAHFMHMKETWTDSHHVFRLKIHHAAPGKMPVQMRVQIPVQIPVLEQRLYRASILQARHGLALAGSWIPEDAKFQLMKLTPSLSLLIEKSRNRGDGEWPFAIQHYVATTGNDGHFSIGQ
jgi:hypothetical protein